MSTALLRATLEYAAIGEAIQRTARDLPEGYIVDISVEHHGGGVALTLPNGDEDDYPSNHERLSESIADALQYAQEHAKKPLSVHQELAAQRPKCLPGCYFDDCSSPNAWTVHAEGCPNV